jgi:MtN3 and saliva related transmembrane protein
MNFTSVIGISASVFTALSLLPQLVKMMKEKKSDDISIGMLIVLLIGLGLWIYYGFLIKDWIIIISNSFSLIINLVTIGLSLKYSKNG